MCRPLRLRRRLWLREAVGAAAPVDDLGFVDLIAAVVSRPETRRGSDDALHVHQAAARAADKVMVVVADPVLESGRGARGLNAPDQAFSREHAQSVVHRLERNRADLPADDVGDAVGGDVGFG